MKKVFYLSTCDTCKRILDELGLKAKGFEMQDIKTEKITEAQLREMADKAGSYEALFSRVARKYKELGLAGKKLSENDYKNYILGEYTFLKRPVILYQGEIFVGNSKSTVEKAANTIR